MPDLDARLSLLPGLLTPSLAPAGSDTTGGGFAATFASVAPAPVAGARADSPAPDAALPGQIPVVPAVVVTAVRAAVDGVASEPSTPEPQADPATPATVAGWVRPHPFRQRTAAPTRRAPAAGRQADAASGKPLPALPAGAGSRKTAKAEAAKAGEPAGPVPGTIAPRTISPAPEADAQPLPVAPPAAAPASADLMLDPASAAQPAAALGDQPVPTPAAAIAAPIAMSGPITGPKSRIAALPQAQAPNTIVPPTPATPRDEVAAATASSDDRSAPAVAVPAPQTSRVRGGDAQRKLRAVSFDPPEHGGAVTLRDVPAGREDSRPSVPAGKRPIGPATQVDTQAAIADAIRPAIADGVPPMPVQPALVREAPPAPSAPIAGHAPSRTAPTMAIAPGAIIGRSPAPAATSPLPAAVTTAQPSSRVPTLQTGDLAPVPPSDGRVAATAIASAASPQPAIVAGPEAFAAVETIVGDAAFAPAPADAPFLPGAASPRAAPFSAGLEVAGAPPVLSAAPAIAGPVPATAAALLPPSSAPTAIGEGARGADVVSMLPASTAAGTSVPLAPSSPTAPTGAMSPNPGTPPAGDPASPDPVAGGDGQPVAGRALPRATDTPAPATRAPGDAAPSAAPAPERPRRAPAPLPLTSIDAPIHRVAPAAPATPTSAAAPATRDDSWMQAMIEQIELAADGVQREARIRLSPDALGTVEVRIQAGANGVEVQLRADNPAARALLAEQAPRLAELADARGLRLGQAQVDAGAGGSGGQGRGQSGQAAAGQAPSANPATPPETSPLARDNRVA